MASKSFKNRNCDLAALSADVKNWFTKKGFEIQTKEAENAYFIQARKTSRLRKAVGASRAFNCLIEGSSDDFTVDLSVGEWMKNIAATGIHSIVITGGLGLVIGGLAAAWSKKIQEDLWSFIEQKVIFR